jgi:GTPase
VFDFAPQVEIGAEILSRRGEDQRLSEERPAARRRRERDRAYHSAEEAGEDQPADDDA